MYNLICMSFDGEYVTEKRGFDTMSDAWEHDDDMGSRWYFYPFHFVTTESGLSIADTPEELERFKHKRVETVQAEFAELATLPETQNMDAEEYALILSEV